MRRQPPIQRVASQMSTLVQAKQTVIVVTVLGLIPSLPL
jgi:hypothetical protein